MVKRVESKNFKKGIEYKKTKYLIYIFSFLILLFIYQTFPGRFKNIVGTDSDTNLIFGEQNTPSDIPISEEDLKEEDGKYVDPDLKFSFRYPKGAEIQNCQQKKCVYVPLHSIRIEFLQSNYYEHPAVKDALFDIDLFCSYESELMTVLCTNIKMEEFVNSNGAFSYVLYRSKFVRETSLEDQTMKSTTYHEKLYMFPVKDELYGMAILSTDSPLKVNQDALFELANSFKLI